MYAQYSSACLKLAIFWIGKLLKKSEASIKGVNMRIWNTLPMDSLTLIRGEGCTVWDNEGNSYLDLLSGYWCNILGHSNPSLVEPVKSQLDKLVNIKSSFQTQEIEEAIKKIEEILPPELNRIAFLSSGSEAVDLALKMARAATDRSGIIVHDIGYYGATSYTL
ncbi:aminotransferase class III-fold pyridoxal phosphate-dependent enzyme, partial [Candidatus Bathyarchaeota archaeon]